MTPNTSGRTNYISWCGILGFALLFVSLPCSNATAREPSDFEQFMLELINRARLDPDAEVVRTAGSDEWDGTPDLNEGLAPGTITSDPKQPFAFHLLLIDAASDYSDLLLANSAFTHTFGGTDPQGRMTAAGYNFVAPAASAENLSLVATTPGFLSITAARVDQQHTGLFADEDSPTRAHRLNLMNPSLREVGIGVRFGTDFVITGQTFDAILTTQDFTFSEGSNSGDPFLTGVAYNDIVDDDFYSPGTGEGLSLAVEAYTVNTNNLVASTSTFASGGYTLAGLASGLYDVRFVGAGVDQTFFDVDFSGSQNVKLDAIDPIVQVLLGDINGNRKVDAADYTVWANAFGQMGPDLPADINGNDLVDAADYTLWANNFGQFLPGSSPSSGPAAVPEPSALSLAVLGIFFVALGRAIRRGRKIETPSTVRC